MRNISPWEHTPAIPLEQFTAAPLFGRLVLAGALITLGLARFQRRDLQST